MYNDLAPDFLSEVYESGRMFAAEIEIKLKNGQTKILDFSDLSSLDQNSICSDSKKITLGYAASRTFNFSLYNDDGKFNNYKFEGATVIPKIKVDSYNAIPLGKFYIDDIPPKNNIINIKASDGMLKFDIEFISSLQAPVSMHDFIKELCRIAGVRFMSDNYPNQNFVIRNKEFFAGADCRQLLQKCAELCASFAIINRDGALELKRFPKTGAATELNPSNMMSYEPIESPLTITGLKCKALEKDFIFGNIDDYPLMFEDNSILFIDCTDTEIRTALENVWNTIKDLTYLPLKTSGQGNPALDVGDRIKVTGLDGITYESIITDITFSGNFGMSITSAGEVSQKNKGFQGTLNNSVEALKKIVEDLLKIPPIAGMNGAVLKTDGETIFWSLSESTVVGLFGNPVTMDGRESKIYSINSADSNITINITNTNLIKENGVVTLTILFPARSSAQNISFVCGNGISVDFGDTSIGTTVSNKTNEYILRLYKGVSSDWKATRQVF